jgi:hypothetical protein
MSNRKVENVQILICNEGEYTASHELYIWAVYDITNDKVLNNSGIENLAQVNELAKKRYTEDCDYYYISDAILYNGEYYWKGESNDEEEEEY